MGFSKGHRTRKHCSWKYQPYPAASNLKLLTDMLSSSQSVKWIYKICNFHRDQIGHKMSETDHV